MAHTMGFTHSQIKYRGIFDFGGLLRTMRQWFVESGYTFNEVAHELKPGEKKVRWEGKKNINPFCQFQINIFFQIRDYNEIEVVQQGQKKKMVQGRMFIEFTTAMNLDYKNSFEKNQFLLFIRSFLINYVLRKKITGGWGDTIYYTTYKLHRRTKEFLGMETKTDSSRYREL